MSPSQKLFYVRLTEVIFASGGLLGLCIVARLGLQYFATHQQPRNSSISLTFGLAN